MVIVPEPFVGIFNGLSGVGPQSEPFVSSTFFQPQIVDVGLQTFELLFGIDHDKRRLTKVNIIVDSIEFFVMNSILSDLAILCRLEL